MPQKVARRLKKIRRAKSFDPASSIFSKTTSPSIATISPLAKPVSPSNAAPSSKAASPRCGFEGALPDNSFTLQLTRGDRNLYSLDLALP